MTMRTVAVLLIAAAVSLAALPAQARQTGWISGFEWSRIARALTDKGEMPVAVECRDRKSAGLTLTSGEANVRIEKNTDGIKWHWAYGDRVNVVKPKLERDGYKMVSYSEYTRASGLKVRCAIWHKR